MKKILLPCLLFLLACSSEQTESDAPSINAVKDTSVEESNLVARKMLSLLDVSDCARDSLTMNLSSVNVDTLFVKENDGRLELVFPAIEGCASSGMFDYVIDADLENDTLTVDFHKTAENVDVLCSCLYWVTAKVNYDFDASYITSSGKTFVLVKNGNE